MADLNHIKGYRITKYDPKYRDEEDGFNLDTWTEYSDLGKVFNNKIFEMDEYLEK